MPVPILISALCTATVSSPHIDLFAVGLTVNSADQAAQDLVRDKVSGRGILYPDTFSEERLTLLPPAASVLLVLFSRNHNVSCLDASYDIFRTVYRGEIVEDK